eukprot:351123-Chlamydomonas_euryale.AAC.4
MHAWQGRRAAHNACLQSDTQAKKGAALQRQGGKAGGAAPPPFPGQYPACSPLAMARRASMPAHEPTFPDPPETESHLTHAYTHISHSPPHTPHRRRADPAEAAAGHPPASLPETRRRPCAGVPQQQQSWLCARQWLWHVVQQWPSSTNVNSSSSSSSSNSSGSSSGSSSSGGSGGSGSSSSSTSSTSSSSSSSDAAGTEPIRRDIAISATAGAATTGTAVDSQTFRVVAAAAATAAATAAIAAAAATATQLHGYSDLPPFCLRQRACLSSLPHQPRQPKKHQHQPAGFCPISAQLPPPPASSPARDHAMRGAHGAMRPCGHASMAMRQCGRNAEHVLAHPHPDMHTCTYAHHY